MTTRPAAHGPDVRLLVPALVAWALLVVLQLSKAPLVLTAGLAVVGLTVAAAAVTRRSPRRATLWRVLGATGAACALGATALSGQLALRSAGTLDELAAEQAAVVVEGVVESDPRPWSRGAGRALDEPVVLTEVRVERVVGRGAESRVSAPVLVVADPSWLSVAWHERVQVSGRLRAAEPGEGAVAVLRVSGPPAVLAPAGPVEQAAGHVRSRLREATSGLPDDAAGLVPALVVGDRSRTPPDLTDAMLATGMTHLTAVSGSNIAIVAAATLAACRALGLHRRWRPAVVALTIVGFVVVVRPEPSVLRAAAMGLVGLLGLTASRKRTGLPALAATVILLLCWDPWLARSYGFGLSVLATLGLLLLVAPISGWVARALPRRLRGLADLVAVPLAAQVMCAPLLVLLQGSLSLVAVPANVAAAPLVAPTTIAGALVALLSLVSPPTAAVLSWAAGAPALAIASVARLGAAVPHNSLPWPPGAPGAALLAVMLAAVTLLGPALAARARRHPTAALGAALLALGAFAPTPHRVWPMPGWQVAMCDVGQGDATVLATGPGRAVVVDTGPQPALLDDCLRRLDVDAIDAVVLTHFHADHIDGLPAALRRPVTEILVTPVRQPRHQAGEVATQAQAANVPVTAVAAGDLRQWGPVQARVCWPARMADDGTAPNNASVVLAVDAPDLRLLLLGDIEREAARGLLDRLRADPWWAAPVHVLKVAHHGSANRVDELYAQASAALAVVSVGADNDYGHPAPSTVHALQRTGAVVHRTDERGGLALRSGPDGRLLVAASR